MVLLSNLNSRNIGQHLNIYGNASKLIENEIHESLIKENWKMKKNLKWYHKLVYLSSASVSTKLFSLFDQILITTTIEKSSSTQLSIEPDDKVYSIS
jgi:hypothetical protein